MSEEANVLRFPPYNMPCHPAGLFAVHIPLCHTSVRYAHVYAHPSILPQIKANIGGSVTTISPMNGHWRTNPLTHSEVGKSSKSSDEDDEKS